MLYDDIPDWLEKDNTRRQTRFNEARHREHIRQLSRLHKYGGTMKNICRYEKWLSDDHSLRKCWGRQDIKLNIGDERRPRVKGRALVLKEVIECQ